MSKTSWKKTKKRNFHSYQESFTLCGEEKEARCSKANTQLKDSSICYECNKPKQFKFECSDLDKLKRNSVGPRYEKKKVLMSTQEDLDTSNEDEDAKVCLVVGNDESTSGDSNEEVYFSDLHLIIHAYYC